MQNRLAGKLTQKILFVHVILEGLPSIDEDYRDFIIELTAQLEIGIDIDFAPGKASTAREFGETLFHDFAQMTAFAGIDYDAARVWHARQILA
jgi:hypothetical protein